MIDSLLRTRLLPVIDTIGMKVAQSGLSANKVTVMAFAFGIAGCLAVGLQSYLFGLLLLLINRGLDAVAGSIARKSGITDRGTILDLFFDYMVFAGFAFFFSLSAMETMLASTLLIFSYLAMGMAYLAHAWVLARRKNADMPRGGIVENGEMIVFLALSCLLPGYYAAFAAVLSIACWITAILRFRNAIADSTL